MPWRSPQDLFEILNAYAGAGGGIRAYPDAQISIILDADEPAAIAEKGNAAKGRSGPILNYPPAGRTAARKIRTPCLSSNPKSSQQLY